MSNYQRGIPVSFLSTSLKEDHIWSSFAVKLGQLQRALMR